MAEASFHYLDEHLAYRLARQAFVFPSRVGQDLNFAGTTELTVGGPSFGSGEDERLDGGQANILCSSELNR